MSKLSNQISYLKGLVDGKNLAEKNDEGKYLSQLIDVVEEVIQQQDQMNERLSLLEEFKDSLLGEMDEFTDMLKDYFDGVIEDNVDDFFDGLEIVEEDDDVYEVTCDKCGTTYEATFDDFIDDNVVCPECGNVYNLADDIVTRLIEGDHKHD